MFPRSGAGVAGACERGIREPGTVPGVPAATAGILRTVEIQPRPERRPRLEPAPLAEPAAIPRAMGSCAPPICLRIPSRRPSRTGAESRHDGFDNDPRRVGPELAPAKADPGVGPRSYAFRSENPSSRPPGDAERNAISGAIADLSQGFSRRILAAGRSVFDSVLKIAGARKTGYIKA